MADELISIIVPIYNVEKYLRQCLDSIAAQTYQNFECLLINDGSPDNSADICREYAVKDSRFKYFEKENGGVSSARNLGIECSGGGAYITFIDSDDWVDSDYLEVLYSAILEEQADIAVSTYKKFNISDNCWYFHSFQAKYDRKVFTNIELINELVDLDSFDFSYRFVSGKLVNRTSLKKIRFNEWTTLGEDMEFWFKLYLISKIVYINRDSYIYRVSDHSGHFDLEKFRSDLQQYLNFLTFLSIKGFDTSRYKDRCISLIKGRDQIVKELADYDTDENIRWFNETLFLLEGENR